MVIIDKYLLLSENLAGIFPNAGEHSDDQQIRGLEERMIRESINKILQEYLQAKAKSFKGHSLAYFIRHDFPASLR